VSAALRGLVTVRVAESVLSDVSEALRLGWLSAPPDALSVETEVSEAARPSARCRVAMSLLRLVSPTLRGSATRRVAVSVEREVSVLVRAKD